VIGLIISLLPGFRNGFPVAKQGFPIIRKLNSFNHFTAENAEAAEFLPGFLRALRALFDLFYDLCDTSRILREPWVAPDGERTDPAGES